MSEVRELERFGANDSWVEFCRTDLGDLLRRFFVKLNKEISEYPSKEVILLLNTRKGYWIYKLFEKNEQDFASNAVILSDRYLQKSLDFENLKKKYIYLVDDTVSRGLALLKSYRLLADHIDRDYIIPVVFGLNGDVDLKKNIAEGDEVSKAFWRRLKCYVRMPKEDIGEFCVQETKLMHKQGIPYVIDLPFFKYAGSDKKTSFHVALTREQFDELQRGNEKWTFHHNVCQMEAGKIFQGFIIQYADEMLLKGIEHYVHDLVVEGTYVTETDMDGTERILVTFIPFAIMKSMELSFIDELYTRLYKGFDYEQDFLDSCVDDKLKKNYYDAKYRKCVYLLSLFIAQEFRRYVKGFGIQLAYDYDIMQEHCTKNFIRSIQKIADCTAENTSELYDNIYNTQKIENLYKPTYSEYEYVEKSEYSEEDAFNLITLNILKIRSKALAEYDKDKVVESEILTIEDYFKILNDCFIFDSETMRRYAYTRNIITLLNISFCSNILNFNKRGNDLIRGFRYGENSDLLLPFFDIYFYWAMYLMFEVKKTTKEIYQRFAEKFYEFAVDIGILYDDSLKRRFEFNKRYYQNTLNYDGVSLKNKYFYLKPYLEDRCDETETCFMRKVERFVENFER